MSKVQVPYTNSGMNTPLLSNEIEDYDNNSSKKSFW